MKKNFFKKLSFVLALAMIVSVIAPAAGAFAATATKLNSTSKILVLGQDGKNAYDFNVLNKKSGVSYKWTSSKSSVVSVSKTTGVATAVAKGYALLTVKGYDAKGKVVQTLKAHVRVMNDIKSLTITGTPAKDTVAVGAENDFNRTYVTQNGDTTGTTSKTVWAVTADGKATTDATISANGVFKATKTGTYEVTAVAFQSASTFDAFVQNADVSLVLATASYTVKVAPSIVATKQINGTKFSVEFDSDMSKSDLATKAVLYQVISGKDVNTGTEKIKGVTYDTTGKIATVELYTAVNAKTEYKLVYGDLTATFTAASTDVADIAGIVFDDFNVSVTGNEDMKKHVNAVNKDGVVILAGNDNKVAPYLTFTYGGDAAKGNVSGFNAYVYTAGYAAPVTAKYSNFVLNSTTKAYDAVSFTDNAVATGVKANLYTASTMQFEAIASTEAVRNDATWKGTLQLAAGDKGYLIQARYKTSTKPDTYQYTDGTTFPDGVNPNLKFTSSDTSKLLISGYNLYPVAEGKVTIIVKDTTDNDKVVTTFDVTITAKRSFAGAVQSTTVLTVGNDSVVGETADANIKLTDSLGAAFNPKSFAKDFVNPPAGASVPTITNIVTNNSGDDKGKVTFTVDAKSASAGVYNLKITLKDDNDVAKDVYFSVNVLDSSDRNIATWRLELDSTSVDLKKTYDKDITANVYGYNDEGTRVALLGTDDYFVTVKNSNDTKVASGSNIIAVVDGPAASAVTVLNSGVSSTGTFSVTAALTAKGVTDHFATRALDSLIGSAVYTVTDSTTKSFALDKGTVDKGTILDVVKAAYNFKLNGDDVNEGTATFSNISYSIGTNAGLIESTSNSVTDQDVYINFVVIRVATTNGAYIDYKYTIGQVIKVNK